MDNAASSYRRFLDGDEGAFDDIMAELFDNLVFFINRYLHDIPASEDIAMDVFVDLIVKKHKYNFKASLKTYVFMIGRSRALNYLKRQKRIVGNNFALEAECSSAESIAQIQQNKQEILQALDKLSVDMQTAVYLVYFEDMSYEDAASVMKKSKKQIDNLLYRAKKELRTILGKDGDLI